MHRGRGEGVDAGEHVSCEAQFGQSHRTVDKPCIVVVLMDEKPGLSGGVGCPSAKKGWRKMKKCMGRGSQRPRHAAPLPHHSYASTEASFSLLLMHHARTQNTSLPRHSYACKEGRGGETWHNFVVVW